MRSTEDRADNPIAARMRDERQALLDAGVDEIEAAERAGYRVFGSKPGAYGAGLQALIDERGWQDRTDLAEAYLVWGAYAYGARAQGEAQRGIFETRLNPSKRWCRTRTPGTRPARQRRLLPVRGWHDGGGGKPRRGAADGLSQRPFQALKGP